MGEPAQRIRRLACDLRPGKPLGKKGSPAFAAVGYHPDPSRCGEPDTLEVQRWVNEYLRGILGGRCARRVLLELAQGAGIEGVELLL